MMQVRLDLELIGVILYETWMIHGGMMKKIEIELITLQIWTFKIPAFQIYETHVLLTYVMC